jgi:hypothetical protein
MLMIATIYSLIISYIIILQYHTLQDPMGKVYVFAPLMLDSVMWLSLAKWNVTQSDKVPPPSLHFKSQHEYPSVLPQSYHHDKYSLVQERWWICEPDMDPTCSLDPRLTMPSLKQLNLSNQ